MVVAPVSGSVVEAIVVVVLDMVDKEGGGKWGGKGPVARLIGPGAGGGREVIDRRIGISPNAVVSELALRNLLKCI